MSQGLLMYGFGMSKHRILLAAPAGEAASVFRLRMLQAIAPRVLALAPDLAAFSVCLVDATPDVAPWQRPGEAAQASVPPVDAVFDLWGDAPAIERALAALATLLPDVPRHMVRVDEHVEKDQLTRSAVGRVEGVKFLSLMRFQADLSDQAVRRLWAHHARLALEVHVGMARYVRDVVVSTTSGGLELPPFAGVAELHFPSAEAMHSQWFSSDAGRAAIVHDVGHFLLSATRLYTSEHVLKPSS